MAVLNTQIAGRRSQTPLVHTFAQISDLKELHSLLEDEGLVYPQRADLYHELALWWKETATYDGNCGDMALQVARRKLDLDIMCNGHESPEVRKTLSFIRRLK